MNTPAVILNDQSLNIEQQAQRLVEQLSSILAYGDGGAVLGQFMKVLPSKHSSEVTLYIMTGNTMLEVTEENLERYGWLRERAAKALEEIGFIPRTKIPD